MTDQSIIEAKISAERSRSIAISGEAGGLDVKDMAQLFEVAKFMAQARVTIPAFLQGSPWDCLGIVLQAREWRMSPFQVARMCYVTENPRTGEKQLGFMAQLVHAVLEARAPIKGRMRIDYEGDGDDRVCIVSATLSDALGGETKQHKSPKLGARRPKPHEKTNRQTGEKYTTTAGSPLWQTKPDVQLAYDTQRDFARLYFPDVLMGVYTDDELAEAGFEEIPSKDLKRMPAQVQMAAEESLSTRLSPDAVKRAGFNVASVVATVDAAKNGTQESASAMVSAPPGEAPGAIADGVDEASPSPGETPNTPAEGAGEVAADAEHARGASPALTELPTSGATTTAETPTGGVVDEAPAAPTDDVSYQAHVFWWAGLLGADEASARWKSERTIRNKLQISAETVDACKKFLEATFAPKEAASG